MDKFIKVKVRPFDSSKNFKSGEFVEWNGVVYKFVGYDYGTYPIVEDLETGEQKTLPHY